MAETVDLLRLMTWLSPAFPVGAFSYSGGLEQVVADGAVRDAGTLQDWLESLLAHGNLWNDAVLFAAAHRAAGDSGRLAEVVELAEALAGSAERHRETMLQGEAFLAAAASWPHPVLKGLGGAAAYPVAGGAVGGGPGVAAEGGGVTGQRHGVAVLAALEARIAALAAAAAGSTLDDLGSAAMRAEIASLRHETLPTRLFRS